MRTITGVWASYICDLMVRKTSILFIPGKPMSKTTKSGFSSCAMVSATDASIAPMAM